MLTTECTTSKSFSINEVILAFIKHAAEYFIDWRGKPTAELLCFKSAFRPLKKLFGETQVKEFGPLPLRLVRDTMIENKWSRGYVNKSVNRIRHLFKWDVSHELVRPGTLEALCAIEGLRAGKTKAVDHPKRKPVSQDHIVAVKRAATKQRTRDLIDLQLLTAARPSELLLLTTGMIDTSGEVWHANLEHHKTKHRGKERTLYFGPKAQMILRRYLNQKQSDKSFFSLRRDSYSHSIKKICDRIGIPRFCPHRHRHTAATRLRKEYGLKIAQVMLGHSKADVTEIYAQANRAAAIDVAKKNWLN